MWKITIFQFLAQSCPIKIVNNHRKLLHHIQKLHNHDKNLAPTCTWILHQFLTKITRSYDNFCPILHANVQVVLGCGVAFFWNQFCPSENCRISWKYNCQMHKRLKFGLVSWQIVLYLMALHYGQLKTEIQMSVIDLFAYVHRGVYRKLKSVSSYSWQCRYSKLGTTSKTTAVIADTYTFRIFVKTVSIYSPSECMAGIEQSIYSSPYYNQQLR